MKAVIQAGACRQRHRRRRRQLPPNAPPRRIIAAAAACAGMLRHVTLPPKPCASAAFHRRAVAPARCAADVPFYAPYNAAPWRLAAIKMSFSSLREQTTKKPTNQDIVTSSHPNDPHEISLNIREPSEHPSSQPIIHAKNKIVREYHPNQCFKSNRI